LTSYGKEALAVLKEHKVIADASHLNEKSFYGVLEYAQGKIVATHSLSYSVFPHKRNLKDHQIKALYEKKGLVGLNLYPDFIKGKDCVASEVFPHIEKLVSLTGYDFLGFGGDFDGADMPSDLKGIEDMDGFLEDLRAFLKDDKAFLNIAYNNVRNFIYEAF
jgi:membrane dipeptidase